MPPTISVVMPVHNGERHIAEALRSILWQTHRDFECLVIDDGSTDATPAILHKFADLDGRITVIRKNHTGLVDSLNLGLMHAQAPVIARMDADDVSLPSRFEIQLSALTDSRATAVSARSVKVDDAGLPIDLMIVPDIRGAEAQRVRPHEPHLPHPFMMFLRDPVLDLGAYRHCLYAEDADLCWRLWETTPTWNLPDVLGHYRVHQESVSSSAPATSRVQAVSARLAALSHLRRVQGRADLVFSQTAADVAPHAGDFEQLVGLHAATLSPRELRHLRVSAALQFLATARWRGFAPSERDLDFTRRALAAADDLLGPDRTWAWTVLQQAEGG